MTQSTCTDPHNPLSIFERWDPGYGETDYPKQIPDGALDAKVGSTEMVRSFMALRGEPDVYSKNTGFWMLYAPPGRGETVYLERVDMVVAAVALCSGQIGRQIHVDASASEVIDKNGVQIFPET